MCDKAKLNIPKIENMTGRSGSEVANQFLIFTEEGVFFQSYSSIIAFKPQSGKIQLDREKWDYSVTTGKYRNSFLRESKKETQRKIDEGIYILTDLNQ